MTVQRLVSLFSCFTKLPVEVAEVRDQILEWGYYDSITIAPFSSSANDLRGLYINYDVKRPYGHTQEHRVIRYNVNLSIPWQRLVCVKELMHSLDDTSLKVSSKLQLDALLKEILHDGTNYGSLARRALYEDVAIFQALAVLCPEDVRSELYERHTRDEVTLDEVARTFEIPPEWAGALMQDGWKVSRKILCGV